MDTLLSFLAKNAQDVTVISILLLNMLVMFYIGKKGFNWFTKQIDRRDEQIADQRQALTEASLLLSGLKNAINSGNESIKQEIALKIESLKTHITEVLSRIK